MRLKQGRIGGAEAVSAAAAAVCANGLFTLDPDLAYEKGNTTFITAPLAVLVSLAVTLTAVSAMKSTGCRDLASLARRSAGNTLGLLLSLPLIIGLLLCAAAPLYAFAQVLHGLVYDGVAFTAILAFIVPVSAALAFMGFETIGRTAKCFALLFLVSLTAAAASAAPGFEGYRLTLAMGAGVPDMLSEAGSFTVLLLPPLIALPVNGLALQGSARIKSAAVKTALICAFITTAALVSVALAFTPSMLKELMMPLYRIGVMSPGQSYVPRLDKLFIMVWLGAAQLCGGYCIYSSALLYARLTDQKDVTPAVLTGAAAVFSLLAALPELPAETLAAAKLGIYRYGPAALLLGTAGICLPAVIKRGFERKAPEGRRRRAC